MARRSLYELLGVSNQASADQIEAAYILARADLSQIGDAVERRNRQVFLDHAKDRLLDPKARADHDLEQAQALEIRQPGLPKKRSWSFSWVGGFFILLLALVAYWKSITPPRTLQTTTVVPGAARTSPIEPGVAANLPKLADIEALVPERTDPPAPDPRPTPAAPPLPAQPAVKAEPIPVQIMVDKHPVLDKIIGSTFAIVGTQGFGTGVMIDKERLLTNCHVLAPNVLQGKIYAISAQTRERYEITEAAFLVKEDACVAYAPGLKGQVLAIGDTRAVRAGSHFYNLGFAEGKLTLSDGVYLGSIIRSQQTYMVSTNYCAPGVSGGALVNDEGQLMGLTSGGPENRSVCLSLTAETARSVLSQTLMQINAFPQNYLTNLKRNW